ncbi:MAG: 3'-5' exoribonuclease YhaM family protein [Bacillota bacterium]
MAYKKIQEFAVGETVEGFFLIKAVSVKVSSNQSKYMDLTLGDQTGEINGKLWDCSNGDEEIFINSTLVKVRGGVTEWQGKLQLRIDKIRLANESDQLSIEEFVPAAPYKPDEMYDSVLNYIEEIEHPDMKRLVLSIFESNKEKLYYFPAAQKNHHAIRSGLLYHILRMLMTAEKLCQVYPSIDKDLLYAGVILHDIAKLEELNANTLGIVSDYTAEGHLLGHIIQGIKLIEKTGEALGVDKEISTVLQHMVLSHHYEPEFGSPKKPMIPEAELLHYLDMIDARMYDMEKALSTIEPAGFTEKIWSLDNRKLYKPAFKEWNQKGELE